ncbi:MFS transporter [Pseudarthrobacter sp. So.54]
MTINDMKDQAPLPGAALTTTAQDQSSAPATPRISKMQKRVLAGGSIGQFIEFYDFTLYGLTAVIFSQLFFPGSNPVTALLATFATFGVAFVVRPIGGLFFGALGDRIGRRRVLTITLIAIGGATALMGLLPTYGQIGAWAPVLLVLCRLIQGFSMPAANPWGRRPLSSSTPPSRAAGSGSTSPSQPRRCPPS